MKLEIAKHELFFGRLNEDDMIELLRIDEDEEYRGRGSTFYHTDIIEVKPEHQEYFIGLDITPYLGIWKTNRYITDAEYGTDGDDIDSLTKVKRTEVQEIKVVWEEVKEKPKSISKTI